MKKNSIFKINTKYFVVFTYFHMVSHHFLQCLFGYIKETIQRGSFDFGLMIVKKYRLCLSWDLCSRWSHLSTCDKKSISCILDKDYSRELWYFYISYQRSHSIVVLHPWNEFHTNLNYWLESGIDSFLVAYLQNLCIFL